MPLYNKIISQEVLDAIIGDMLGDGSISRGNYEKWPGTNGRLEFTFGAVADQFKIFLIYVI